jgi:hypothetical protein
MATALKLVDFALVDPAKDEFQAMAKLTCLFNHGIEIPQEA